MRTELEPAGPAPAGDETSARDSSGSGTGSDQRATRPRAADSRAQPLTLLARPSGPRRVPVAVIAGVEWFRLLEDL